MTELSVSVVSYRTPTLLRQCLQALERERGQVDLDVTVVDNASGDGSSDLVRSEFPWVRLLCNMTNVGFGAAHNQALADAAGTFWLILNSDAAPYPGALRTLLAYLETHPRVAVAGPQLRLPDGEIQPSRRRFPSLATLFVESTQVQRWSPRNRLLDRFYMNDRPADRPQEVDWLVGACLCVRGAAARQIGGFDERFFMYSEELDWCRRFRAAGWTIAYVPQARVGHLEGASARQNLAARDRYFQTSKLRYAAKWHGATAARLLQGFLIGEYLLRGAEESVKLALGSRRAERRARLRVIGSGLRSVLGA
jgi:GT2 family glycosyltransferase